MNNQSSSKGLNTKKKNSVLFTLKKLMKEKENFKIVFGNQKLDRKSAVVKMVLNQIIMFKDVFLFMKGIKSLELPSKMTIQSILNTNE